MIYHVNIVGNRNSTTYTYVDWPYTKLVEELRRRHGAGRISLAEKGGGRISYHLYRNVKGSEHDTSR